MKKLVLIILCAVMVFSSCITKTYAETSYSWYTVKKGHDTPIFPQQADFVENHNGYFIDKKADENDEKIIYLTFDAGYENGNIEKILDILKEEEVKGAFFILQNLINKNPELVKRISDEGHILCNHTKNHKDMTTLTESEMIANLKFLEDLCEEKTGCRMAKYFRFPEGRYNEEVLMTAENNGYSTFFWSLTYADWDNAKQIDSNVAIKKLLDNLHSGAIILLHPTSATNVKILGDFIRATKDEGYSFSTLDKLIERNKCK